MITFESNDAFFDFAALPGMRNWFALADGRLSSIATGRTEEEAMQVFTGLRIKADESTTNLTLGRELQCSIDRNN